MANFRRKRPRKQPASYMSSFDRIDKSPRERDVNDNEVSEPQHPKKKLFVLQRRFIAIGLDHYWMISEWTLYKKYTTRKAAENALKQLKNTIVGIKYQYRIVEEH